MLFVCLAVCLNLSSLLSLPGHVCLNNYAHSRSFSQGCWALVPFPHGVSFPECLHLSVGLPQCPSVYLICLLTSSSICLPQRLSDYLNVCLLIAVAVYLCVCLLTSASVYLNVFLVQCLFPSMSTCLVQCLFTSVFVYLSVCLFICLFISLSVCLTQCLSG